MSPPSTSHLDLAAEMEAARLHSDVALRELHAEVERLKRRLHDAETYIDGKVSASTKAMSDAMTAVHKGHAVAAYELIETYGDCRARAAVTDLDSAVKAARREAFGSASDALLGLLQSRLGVIGNVDANAVARVMEEFKREAQPGESEAKP